MSITCFLLVRVKDAESTSVFLCGGGDPTDMPKVITYTIKTCSLIFSVWCSLNLPLITGQKSVGVVVREIP